MAGRRVNKKTKRKKKRIGTMDLILLLVFICLVIFTVTMIRLFQVYGSVPDTLVTCVFATLGGECGILVYGDNVFEKDGIRRDRTGDGEKTRCLCGKRGIFNRDGPAMGPQIIRQLE